ncbi:hypothetical protein GCM10023197_13620 [Gordonia humi]
MLGVALGLFQCRDGLAGLFQRRDAPFVVFVEPLFPGFELRGGRRLLVESGLGVVTASMRGLDGLGEPGRLPVDRLDLGAQVRGLSLQPGEAFAAVGDGPHRCHMRLFGGGGRLFGGLQRGGRVFESRRGLLDGLGVLGFGHRGFFGLLVEPIRIGTARRGRRTRQVRRTFTGDAACAVDAFGEGRELMEHASGLRGGGRDLREVLLCLGQRRRRLVELRGHLVLTRADLVFGGGVLGHLGASRDEVVGGQAQPGITQIGLHRRRPTGHLGLPAERFELSAEFRGEVGQPREVGGHRVEFADRLLPTAAVFENARGLLDERSAVLRLGLEDRRETPLPDDDVHLPTDARIRQQLLHVHEAARVPVDLVLARAVAEHPARHRDLGVVDGEGAVGVVDGQGHLGAPEGRPPGGAREDDVGHLAPAQRFGPLLPHHPGERVHYVRLARPVGPHHTGDAGLESQRRRRRERFETLQG